MRTDAAAGGSNNRSRNPIPNGLKTAMERDAGGSVASGPTRKARRAACAAALACAVAGGAAADSDAERGMVVLLLDDELELELNLAGADEPPAADDFPAYRVSQAEPTVPPAAGRAVAPKPAPAAPEPLLKLGPGDAVKVEVYGRPDMSTTTYVADEGTIAVPLAGAVAVAGLSPAKAAQQVAAALRKGQFLVNPQVTITLAQFRSQQVSVLGEVRTPGRFPIEARTTVFDLLAQAGGTTENGADVVFLLRPDGAGNVTRHPVPLGRFVARDVGGESQRLVLRGGDAVFVPRAPRFYIHGEVRTPNLYRLEPGMTVVQAIAAGGGVTPRGSLSRIQISRRNAAGTPVTFGAKLTDTVRADDVIFVKERFF